MNKKYYKKFKHPRGGAGLNNDTLTNRIKDGFIN